MSSRYTIGKKAMLTIALAGGLVFTTFTPQVASAEETSQEMIEKKEKVDAEVKKLAQEIEKLQQEIDEKVQAFNKVAEEIKVVDADIVATTKRIEQRSALIGDRMAAYQAKESSLGVYMDAVFGAESITDLMDRVSAVKTLLDADQTILEEQKADNEALKAQKQLLADKQQQLETQFRELQEKESKIEVVKAENEAKSLKLKEQIATKQEEERLEAERRAAEERAAQLRALQQQEFIAQQQQQAAQQQQAVSNGGGGTVSSSTGGGEASAPVAPPAVGGGVGTAINEAHKFIGMPYVWGASNPNVGFDCSGLTQWSYRAAGISLPRTAAQQYLATARVSADQAQAGDLVFFSYGSGIQHVGIYLGNGQMINSQNGGVKVEPLTGFWQRTLVGYGRP